MTHMQHQTTNASTWNKHKPILSYVSYVKTNVYPTTSMYLQRAPFNVLARCIGQGNVHQLWYHIMMHAQATYAQSNMNCQGGRREHLWVLNILNSFLWLRRLRGDFRLEHPDFGVCALGFRGILGNVARCAFRLGFLMIIWGVCMVLLVGVLGVWRHQIHRIG